MHRPNPSAAPICKVRLRYAKRGRLRFTSHRDVARTFERALRRAGLPMAYSQGYSPHPKISWVGAAPTGTASEAEYAEIQLVAQVDPDVVCAELNAALPDGLAVIDGVLAGSGGLAERIEASRWWIEISGVGAEQLRHAVSALLAAPEVLVERITTDGRRSIDARAAIVSLGVEEPPVLPPGPGRLPECGILTAVVRQVSPAVRPDDVVSALGVVAGLRPLAPARATRMAQGRLDDDGSLVDPLAPDRAPIRMAPGQAGDGAPDQHGVAGHAS
ncbi:MAG: TIGR03936 family radical SAM-associated protein [Pseudonocardiaceae bacterium]